MGHDSRTTNVDEDEDDDLAPTFSVQARVDTIIEASKEGEEGSQVILVVEHKAPGTLVKSDWEMGFSTNKALRGNALRISKQCRKYLTGAKINMICVYDSCALVGLSVRLEDRDLWTSTVDISARVFFEDDSSKFLLTLLALAEMGIQLRGWLQ